MSAMLADDLVVPVPTRPQPGRWKHVERGPQARPGQAAMPGGRPIGVAAPQVRAVPTSAGPAAVPASSGADSWRLTDRGIAVAVVFFLAVVATAAVVLVINFLAVNDTPVAPVAPAPAAVIQG